jgi:hypothetical protein
MYPITMLIEAITLAALLSRKPAMEPVVTCHHGTVSYKFVGAPGTAFRYMGETYTVPKRGWIELIRDGGDTTYQVSNRTLELEVWPIDEFGTRTVPLPRADSSPSNPPASTP